MPLIFISHLVCTFQESQCRLCGEADGDNYTHRLPFENFTKIDLSDVVNSTLDVEVAFRPNLNGYLEFRLCHVGEDLERDAVACRESDPILIGNEFPKIMFIPEPEQKNARLKLQMSLNESCSRCVIQAKLVPGVCTFLSMNLDTFILIN